MCSKVRFGRHSETRGGPKSRPKTNTRAPHGTKGGVIDVPASVLDPSATPPPVALVMTRDPKRPGDAVSSIWDCSWTDLGYILHDFMMFFVTIFRLFWGRRCIDCYRFGTDLGSAGDVFRMVCTLRVADVVPVVCCDPAWGAPRCNFIIFVDHSPPSFAFRSFVGAPPAKQQM